MKRQETPIANTLIVHSSWQNNGLKFSSHIPLAPKLLPFFKSQCLA
jgi:hypothetical protein